MSHNNKRKGIDRRQQQQTVDTNNRRGKERRELLMDPDKSIGRLRMSALFDGLSSEQLNKLLLISMKRTYSKEEIIFSEGDASSEMFLLINGKLRVESPDGGRSPALFHSGIIGLAGIFTGYERAVTVIAAVDSAALVFSRDELFKLFDDNAGICTVIQANVIKYLYGKLNQDINEAEKSRGIKRLDIS